jgi:hypothetical protein
VAVLATLAEQNRWELERVQTSEGEALQLSGGVFADLPVRAFQTRGPLTLLWFGLTTVKNYNFDDPQNPIPTTMYRMNYLFDPAAHVHEGDGRTPIRDLPVVFVLDDGRELALESEHARNQFRSGEAWQFAPGRLSGTSAAIKVTVPFHSATRLSECQLDWRQGERREGDTVVHVAALSSKDEEESDPHDFFKKRPVKEWTATVRLVHAEAQSGKLPPERMLVDAHEAWVHGADGSVVPARVGTANGMHSPWTGYTFDIIARTAPGFSPRAMKLAWAHEYQRVEASFEIDGAPLGAQ